MCLKKQGVVIRPNLPNKFLFPLKKYFFVALEISKNILIKVGFIFILKYSYWQYKPRKFPPNFFQHVVDNFMEKELPLGQYVSNYVQTNNCVENCVNVFISRVWGKPRKNTIFSPPDAIWFEKNQGVIAWRALILTKKGFLSTISINFWFKPSCARQKNWILHKQNF